MKKKRKKRRKEEDSLFFGLLLFLLLLFLVISFGSAKQNRVCFKDSCFNVRLLIDDEELALGLMFKESLGQNKGMLFIFEKEGRYGFWMRNMLFPLDIIWINENQEAVFMARNMQPCSRVCRTIMPDKKAKYVLEVNAGTIERINLNLRDEFEFDIE